MPKVEKHSDEVVPGIRFSRPGAVLLAASVLACVGTPLYLVLQLLFPANHWLGHWGLAAGAAFVVGGVIVTILFIYLASVPEEQFEKKPFAGLFQRRIRLLPGREHLKDTDPKILACLLETTVANAKMTESPEELAELEAYRDACFTLVSQSEHDDD